MPWNRELSYNITDIATLQEGLGLTDAEAARIHALCEQFPMSVTRYYLGLIDWKDPADPIRKICIPGLAETDRSGAFDTSGEASNTVREGLQHKYRETALILTTNRCAAYCRHCFRKRLVGLTDEEIAHHMEQVVAYIHAHKELTNVILSGGDALMLPTEMLHKYLETFAAMEHLDLIRMATRMPVVLPHRIIGDQKLQEILLSYSGRKQLYLVTQFNHPRELTAEAREAIRVLRECGVVVKNQTVLLKGVNDDPQVLGTLLRRLTACGVVPYYVFQCRPVIGVRSSFQVPLAKGYDIVEKAKSMQSGQGKCLKYCLSHPQGKIEIVGVAEGGRMIFKFHQAKDEKDAGRILIREISPEDTWLPESV